MRKLSFFNQIIKQVWANIKGNKLRTFLTCLGIIIGISSVIGMWTIMSVTAEKSVEQYLNQGISIIYVEVSGNQTKTGLSPSEIEEIEKMDNVDSTTGTIDFTTPASYGSRTKKGVEVRGREPAYFTKVPYISVLKGRPLNKIDEDNEAKVCVINNNLAGELFQGEQCLGKTIYINGLSMEVVGVYKEKDDEAGSKKKYGMIVPLSFSKKLTSTVYLKSVMVFVKDIYDSYGLYEELEAYMTEKYPREDPKEYYVYYNGDLMMELKANMASQQRQQALIAGISLLVGGIGIMNMMLVSVTERTKEIGLRKALGATPGRIQLQFLLEAICISVGGGIMGIIVGVIISIGACTVMQHSIIINIYSIIISLLFSVMVGVVFGWIPARSASQLNPIDALRAD